MKNKIEETLEIPSGISCEFEGNLLNCKKGSLSLSRTIIIPAVKIKIDNNKIVFSCEKGNKNQLKFIRANIAHIKNIFNGLGEKYIYKLQACNVHFPMTLKVESNKLIINNFLGEKVPRYAKILPGVEVEVKGQIITVSSADRELAGQTSANIEKATKVRNRDRRIFQDGIYLTEKAGRVI